MAIKGFDSKINGQTLEAVLQYSLLSVGPPWAGLTGEVEQAKMLCKFWASTANYFFMGNGIR